MKHPLAGLALSTVSLFAAMALRPPPALSRETVRTPVVVELFTSEGCSSCPPADTLLAQLAEERLAGNIDRKSTRLNSSHTVISYAVFCLKKKKRNIINTRY